MVDKVRVNSDQFTKKWKDGLRGATQAYKDGVNAVTENPCSKAADQADVWQQRTIAARNKWENNLRKVTLSTWKTNTSTKGATALSNSVDAAEPKVKEAAGRIITAMNGALATIPPRGTTLDANLSRVRHVAQAMINEFSGDK